MQFYEAFGAKSISEMIAIELSNDENESKNVDTVIRIFRKAQKGKGKQKFCINLVHTNNSVMVNCPGLTLFNRNHQHIVNSIVRTHMLNLWTVKFFEYDYGTT